jgi:hypothetical protein
MAVNLTKRQLKEFKKMSIEFETSIDDLLQMAVDAFIQKYQDLSADEIDSKGIKSLL